MYIPNTIEALKKSSKRLSEVCGMTAEEVTLALGRAFVRTQEEGTEKGNPVTLQTPTNFDRNQMAWDLFLKNRTNGGGMSPPNCYLHADEFLTEMEKQNQTE